MNDIPTATDLRETAPQNRTVWIDPPLPGPVNMAIDRTLLERAECLDRPVTWVRFYQWNCPTVSLGRHQIPSSAVDVRQCKAWSVPIVRRPTGGRAVLHHDELTFAVVSNDSRLFPLSSVGATYGIIARILQKGLSELGIDTHLSPQRPPRGSLKPRVSAGAGRLDLPCFASVARYELLAGGKKLVGSAQRHLRRSFLEHGSIPISIGFEFMGQLLGTSSGELRKTVTSLSENCDRRLTFHAVAGSLKESFHQFFQQPDRFEQEGCQIEPGEEVML